MAISIAVTSSPVSFFKSYQNFTKRSSSPVHPPWFPCASRANTILCTAKCAPCGLQHARRLGSAALPQPQGSSYKALAKTKRDLSVQEDQPQWPNSKFCFHSCLVTVFLPFAENSHHLGESHNHSVIFIAEIRWYQSHSKIKSLHIVSELRGEAARESLTIGRFTFAS